jgi:ATP-dependent Zn protease
LEISTNVRRTRGFYQDEIAVLLGGIASEHLILGGFDDGASGVPHGDLSQATEIATLIEATFGMGDSLLVSEVDPREFPRTRAFDPELRRRVRDVLSAEFDRAKSIVRDFRPVIDEFIEALVVGHVMSGDDARAIFAQHRKVGVSLVKASRTAES